MESGRAGFPMGAWIAVALAAVIAALIYLLGEFGPHRLHTMVFDRGLIPHFIILVSSAGMGFLVYQYIEIRRSETNLSLLISFVQNNLEEISAFAREVKTSQRGQSSLLTHLFRQVPESKERELITLALRDWTESGQDFALKRLEIHLDLEAQASENAFKIPLVLCWMAPMLGFLGTVWGIALSLGDFTGFMVDVDNVSRIKDGLSTITAGLGIAFDTTLLGLFFAIIMNGAATYLQRRESACLDRTERTALDVLKRMSTAGSGENTGEKRSDLVRSDSAAVSALAEAARELAQQVRAADKVALNPSSELMEAISTLQHYVKYLAVIAKQSDTMAAERKAVESAAEAIKSLKDFSDGLANLSRASQDLLNAVRILEKPREFRLVQHYSPSEDGEDE